MLQPIGIKDLISYLQGIKKEDVRVLMARAWSFKVTTYPTYMIYSIDRSSLFLILDSPPSLQLDLPSLLWQHYDLPLAVL